MKSLAARATRPAPFTVVLLKPSKYDDDGYVVRHLRGVLPSNTLGVMHSLTLEVARKGSLGADVELRTLLYDETVHRIDPARIARRARRGGARAVICLCAVQSNQFPRAADLALQFRALGLPVMIGGFHTSGIMELFPDLTPELQEMVDNSVTLVHGEVEEAWPGLLRDAYEGTLKPRYDIKERPDLAQPPVPELDRGYMRRFAYPNMGTIDAGRGCPFNCSFCTIINVQGRKMRNRSAAEIEKIVRANWKKKVDYYFFTDDNFARNPNWEEVFDSLIRLREQEDIKIDFMIQVDTLAWKIPRFVEKAARAGSSQVFIGMESIRPENLKAAGKTQNKARDYAEMIDTWHRHSIACHVGYILGFPADTPESIATDVHALIHEIHIDQASFFMLTPLPGSKDHLDMTRLGLPMDSDLSKFDSFHPVMRHAKMSDQEWFDAYQQAWKTFYSFESMRTTLTRANHRTYWGLFKNYIWYKAAMIENAHPMITGFLRLKDRTARQRGLAVEGRLKHLRRRVPEILGQLREMFRLFLEMEELWLQTRHAARVGVERPGVGEQIGALASGFGQAALGHMQRAGARVEQAAEAAQVRIGQAAGAAQARLGQAAEAAQARFGQAAGAAQARLGQAAEVAQARFGQAAGAAQARLGQAAEAAQARFGQAAGAAQRSLAGAREGLLMRLNLLRSLDTRQHLAEHWRSTRRALATGRLWRLRPLRSLTNLVRDVNCTTRFGVALLFARTK